MIINTDTLRGLYGKKPSEYETIELPSMIDGEKLTSIEHVKKITAASLGIPSTVTKLGRKLFYPRNVFQECPDLQELKVYDTLTEFGYTAYSGAVIREPSGEIYADTKADVSLKDTFRNIAFSDCPEFRKLVIRHAEDSAGMIQPYLFKGLQELQEVVIEQGVRIIGDEAFAFCPELKKILIPASVEGIRYLAFQHDLNLKIYGYANTFAEEYARTNGYPFHALQEENHGY